MTMKIAKQSLPFTLAWAVLGCGQTAMPPGPIAGADAPAAAAGAQSTKAMPGGAGTGTTLTTAGTGAPMPTAGKAPVATAGNGASAGTSAISSTAGTAATAGTGASAGTSGAVGPNGYPDLRGGCKIDSGYPDDHACIPAPSPEEGMQIHVGPSDYKNAAEVAKYIMKPGQESSECWTFHTPNDKEVYYQTFLLSGRAGTHHIINTMYTNDLTDGGFGGCQDPGTGMNSNIIDNLPGASKAYMPRGTVAPENAHIGRKVPPHAASQADMHYYNFTDHDIIREFWMNIYFAKKEDITMEAAQIRGMGGLSWTIAPIAAHSDMVYPYECAIKGEGRIISLLGHYHAHGKRFTASIKRKAGMVEKVFEMYDYMDPVAFEYDTVNKNPAFSSSAPGAVSGMLAVHDGDIMQWECHIVNDSDVGLTYTNEVKTGEMCNLWGESLGIQQLNCVLP